MLPDVAVCKASNITTGVAWEAELLQGMESLGQCVVQGVAAMACHIATFTPIRNNGGRESKHWNELVRTSKIEEVYKESPTNRGDPSPSPNASSHSPRHNDS